MFSNTPTKELHYDVSLKGKIFIRTKPLFAPLLLFSSHFPYLPFRAIPNRLEFFRDPVNTLHAKLRQYDTFTLSIAMPNRERYSMPPTQSLLGQSPEISDHQVSQSSADKMNPSSPLLQGLLREKKASQHARRASHQSDFATYERQVQSSPMGPSAASRDNGSSNRRISGHAAPNEMGLREMEEVSTVLRD